MERFIPVVVIKELSETDRILTALKHSKMNCAEITFRTSCAAEAIAYAVANYPDMEIGAGTVINAAQCAAATVWASTIWRRVPPSADWFHFTGITPALGGEPVNICLDACKAAKARGVKISCDLNYRGKLWTRAEAREARTGLCAYVDVCISNEEDAKDVFGCRRVLVWRRVAPLLVSRQAHA